MTKTQTLKPGDQISFTGQFDRLGTGEVLKVAKNGNFMLTGVCKVWHKADTLIEITEAAQ